MKPLKSITVVLYKYRKQPRWLLSVLAAHHGEELGPPKLPLRHNFYCLQTTK